MSCLRYFLILLFLYSFQILAQKPPVDIKGKWKVIRNEDTTYFITSKISRPQVQGDSCHIKFICEESGLSELGFRRGVYYMKFYRNTNDIVFYDVYGNLLISGTVVEKDSGFEIQMSNITLHFIPSTRMELKPLIERGRNTRDYESSGEDDGEINQMDVN